MHLDRGIEVRTWREGAPERRSRPRSAEGEASQAVRAGAQRRGRGAPSQVSIAAAPARMNTALARISRRTIVVASLLALAVLSYALMILAPQQVAMRIPTSFMLPISVVDVAVASAEPAAEPVVIGAAQSPSR